MDNNCYTIYEIISFGYNVYIDNNKISISKEFDKEVNYYENYTAYKSKKFGGIINLQTQIIEFEGSLYYFNNENFRSAHRTENAKNDDYLSVYKLKQLGAEFRVLNFGISKLGKGIEIILDGLKYYGMFDSDYIGELDDDTLVLVKDIKRHSLYELSEAFYSFRLILNEKLKQDFVNWDLCEIEFINTNENVMLIYKRGRQNLHEVEQKPYEYHENNRINDNFLLTRLNDDLLNQMKFWKEKTSFNVFYDLEVIQDTSSKTARFDNLYYLDFEPKIYKELEGWEKGRSLTVHNHIKKDNEKTKIFSMKCLDDDGEYYDTDGGSVICPSCMNGLSHCKC